VIPYSTQDITESDLAAVRDALTSGWLTQGPAVPRFEAAFEQAHRAPHAVAVCNATAALHLGCLALGVGPGSRVWTSPNSFVASANCAAYCGAEVQFVDIDPRTRNLSIQALADKLERARRDNALPDVVIPVDFSGLPCDLAEIRGLAEQHGFRVLEDASHAVGASYRGVPVSGGWAHASVFSFHAVKIITTAEGGLVTTDDAALARRVALLRSHGMTRDPAEMTRLPEGPWVYEQRWLGFNYRMTDVQAALGASQITRLSDMQKRRQRLAQRYDELLAALPLVRPIELPDRVSSLHLYVVEIDEAHCATARATVFNRLRSAGIGVNVHYIPIHLQPYWRDRGFGTGDFPNAEAYYHRALSLPLFPAMTDGQQDTVAGALAAALT